MSNFATFLTTTKAKLIASTTLDLAIDDSAPDTHVRVERYACISKDGPLNHDALLGHGPLLYLIPASCDYSPMTSEHMKDEGVLEVDVHSRVVNATEATFITHITFVDNLIDELMTGADGTGGTFSWLSGVGVNLRCSSAMPEQISLTEIRTKVKLKVRLLAAV